MVEFESGEFSTFDIGYTAGTVLMDLQLLGTTGAIGLDDFVLDWNNSWAFQNPDIKVGYTHRTASGTRKDTKFVETQLAIGAHVRMVDAFAELASSNDIAARRAASEATLRTQEILDAMWAGRVR